jgi:hypothetical protein
MIGAIYDGFSNRKLAVLTIAGFLMFQCAALVHNLLIWRDTAYLAQRTCSAFAAQFSGEQEPLTVLPLPRTHEGVYFLANGFPDCVYINYSYRHPILAEL